uniref:Dynamin N-terminal domain-containing protein n=1 Tax=Cyprinus carpio TaxID=7962 RepID=A0A8C2BIR0_CYPCA
MKSHGMNSLTAIKRKRDESPDITAQSLMTTDMEIRNKAKQIIEGVMVQIQAIKNTDHTVNALKTDIVDAVSKLNKVDKDSIKKATIGVFGRTGVGKSSLINAVLGETNLLPSSDMSACTSVITQVEANLSNSNYTAEIEFLISKEEWENEIVSSEKNKDRNNLITEIIEEKIIALYGDDAGKKTLKELKKEEKFIEINNVLSNEKKTISKQNLSDITCEVARYIKNDESNPGGWYWPLVKSVIIKTPNCRELLEHIVLVDIPGTGDCNKIRDDLWRSKLQHCSSVWIVSDINRAVSDKDPWEILEHCIQDLGGGGECKHINFICTKTDQINSGGHLALENEQLDEQMTGPKDLKTKRILQRNSRAKEAVKRKLKNARSRDTKERFITDVFTVSSEAFLDPENPVLEAAETEIPKLRDVLKNLNKNIDRKLTRDYVNEAKGVLSLIQGVQLEADEKMTKAKVHRDLEINLHRALKELKCQFDSCCMTLEECLSAGVEESVRSCVKSTQDMIKSVRPKDNRGFHKIYRAMCERKGYYWPKDWKAPLELNTYLSKHMYDSLDEEFELIFPVDDDDVKTGKSLQEHLDKFSVIQSDSPRSLWQKHIENFIKTQEYKVKASLSGYIVEIKKEIYSLIQKTIQKKMTPGYKKAAQERGEGAMQRMEEIITETIEQLKNQMFNDAKLKVIDMFKILELSIMETLESELKHSVELSFSHAGKISWLSKRL